MKMNINSLLDHDEGHCTSLVKMGSYHKDKDKREDWDGFYCSFHIKVAKKNHLTPAKVANLWDKYVDARYLALWESDVLKDDYMSFEQWLSWKGYTK